MAQRSIREFHAKQLLAQQLPLVSNRRFEMTNPRLLVQSAKELESAVSANPWLKAQNLVVKPDQMIGKKAKNKVMALNVAFPQALEFVKEQAGQTITIGKNTGKLTHFLVEPFVQHQEEYYLALVSQRESDRILFSAQGGIDIEQNWDTVSSLEVAVGAAPAPDKLNTLVSKAPSQDQQTLADYAGALHALFVNLGFTYLELNPLTLVNNNPIPLGTVARLDDTSAFEHTQEWQGISFPAPFGRELSPAEAFVKALDEKTGASLKLTVLNGNGNLWPLIAGGGASVVYADEVVAAGQGSQLAMYGEYSGDPSEEDTYQYAKTVLELMVQSKAPRKALLIGGGIANFTNVANTFKGIIRAIKELAEPIRKTQVHVFVRRGGPYYQEGLQAMKQAAQAESIPIEVYGPETPMTHIVHQSLAWTKAT